MRKLFTIDDFMVALIAALGYGYGYAVAELFGWPVPLCLVACFALGIALEEIVGKIVFSETVQKSTRNRVIAYAVIILVFLAGHFISTRWLGASMIEDAKEEFMWVVGLPLVGFVVNLVIRWNRIRRIRETYDDGIEGYIPEMDEEEVDELNEQNRPVVGEYDAVFEAKSFGASAIQVENRGAVSGHHRQDEDCLTLNLCVGSEKTEGKRPVLVLFHHSGFAFGGSADPLLYGKNYISTFPDTVLVTFNYRLGILGFADFSEVPGGEAYADVLDQWIAVSAYRSAMKLFEGGNKVHLMYWSQKPLLENLGSGTVDVLATLLGNEDALEMYGGVVDKDQSEILQTLLHNYVIGDALQLYRNEVNGIDALDWEPFPKALIVFDDKFSCDTIEDKLTDVDALADYIHR